MPANNQSSTVSDTDTSSSDQGDYFVKQGDCIYSIAYERGFFWETLWKHPKNAGLKSLRKSPGVLFPGDVVFIPDKAPKELAVANEKRHRFKLEGVPSLIRLRILEEARSDRPGSDGEDIPRAHVPFKLYIDDVLTHEGNTDDDGAIDCSILPNARRGRLLIGEGGSTKEVRLNLGEMDPVDELVGIQKRLSNLGFLYTDGGDGMNATTREAIERFQRAYRLEISGRADAPTSQKLKEIHGS